MITTRAFWLGALERAVKTFCQVFLAVAVLSLGDMTVGVNAGITNVDWVSVLSVSALATFFSLVTSIGNADFTAGAKQTPAAVPQTVVVNQPTGDPAVQVDDAGIEFGNDGATAGRHREETATYGGDSKTDATWHP